MKGLEKYIKKHGRHFTERLAVEAVDNRWNTSEIEKCSQRIVYYNVSEATLGDIVFLTNMYYKTMSSQKPSKIKCVKYALSIIGKMETSGYAFNLWASENWDIDLNKYI